MSNDDPFASLRTVKAQTPRRFLGELADRAKRDKQRLPVVVLHLRSGRDLEAVVLDLVTEGSSSTLLCALPSHDRSLPRDVSFVPLEVIEAVTLRDAAMIDRAPAAEGPPPTRLQLRRHFEGVESTLAAIFGVRVSCTIDWSKAPESGEPLRSIGDLIIELERALRAIAKDELGRATLKEKVARIDVGLADEAVVTLSDRVLVVRTTDSWSNRQTAAALEKQIAALL